MKLDRLCDGVRARVVVLGGAENRPWSIAKVRA
jgi:hypothetical protein